MTQKEKVTRVGRSQHTDVPTLKLKLSALMLLGNLPAFYIWPKGMTLAEQHQRKER